jgi:hypothetical protein
MNTPPGTCQPDLFKTRNTPDNSSPRIIIELSGLGPIPSFKNQKRMRAWIDKALKRREWINGEWWIAEKSIKVRAMLFTNPDHQAWMDQAIPLIESQLHSALAIIVGGIQTGALARSRIATLLPLDDCWTSFAELIVRSELCEKGQEGASIMIQPL